MVDYLFGLLGWEVELLRSWDGPDGYGQEWRLTPPPRRRKPASDLTLFDRLWRWLQRRLHRNRLMDALPPKPRIAIVAPGPRMAVAAALLTNFVVAALPDKKDRWCGEGNPLTPTDLIQARRHLGERDRVAMYRSRGGGKRRKR